MTKEPPPMKRGPGKLVSLFNALRDFCISERVIPGEGLRVNETVRGKQLSLTQTLLDLARQYEEEKAGAPGSIPTSPGGKAKKWQTRYVCVADGVGGWTPMLEDYEASDPYAP